MDLQTTLYIWSDAARVFPTLRVRGAVAQAGSPVLHIRADACDDEQEAFVHTVSLCFA